MMKKKKINKNKFGVYSVFVLAFALGYFSNFSIFNQYENNSTYIEESQFISVVEDVSSSVVSIDTVSDLSNTYFRYGVGYVVESMNSSGTGFLVSEDGLIFTNKHLIKDENAIFNIKLEDGTIFNANLVSVDPLEDIAVLQIDTDEIFVDYLTFGNSQDLKIGQKVLAIGNALSIYGNTVTSGIISGMDRDISAYDDYIRDERNFTGLLQTDAAINIGNSGGPLINLNGEVVGMNVAIDQSANSIGFALPSSYLIPVLESIKKNGDIVKPFLGVRYVMLNKDQADYMSIPQDTGAILVPGSFLTEPAIYPGGPAFNAGLKENDVILSVNNEELTIEESLIDILLNYNVGDNLNIDIWRAGEVLNFSIVLSDSSDFIR